MNRKYLFIENVMIIVISDDDEDDGDDFPLVYIICIGIASFIILFIVIFFIIRCIRKRKQGIDLNRETKNMSQEKLMQDL